MMARNSRLSFISIGLAVAALALALVERTGWAVTPCDNIDTQCMSNGVCQADGTCTGTPINEGLDCTDHDPCSAAAKCQSGSCVSTSTKTIGTPCAYEGMGLCMKNAVCQDIAFIGRTICYPPVDENFDLIDPTDVVICEDLGQKCMECNPQTGQCTTPKVPGPCETGECNSSTGLFQDAPDGTACDDFNVCTTGEQCQGGVCRTGGAPTPTPTFSIPPITTCTGDCNDTGVVTIDNVLTMIDIGLGKQLIFECLAGDKNQDSKITVDEDLTAIHNALSGCPALPTPTRTPTSPPQPATATPTRTPTAGGPTPTRTATAGVQTTPGPGSAVSGQTTVAVSAVTVIGDVVAAISNGLTIGSASSTGSSAELLMTPADPGLGGAAASCPLGGSVTSSGNIFSGYNIQFQDDCAVETVDGKVSFNGMASVGLSGLTAAVTATFSNLSGTTVFEEAEASVTGPLVGIPTQGGSCFITAIAFSLSGSLSSTLNPPGGTNVAVLFTNTTLNLSNITFSPACVPTAYNLTLNGPATLLNPDGTPVDVTFNNLTLHITSDASGTTLTVNGGMNSPCFGGTSTIATSTPLTVPIHQGCPTTGVMTATLPQGGSATISFGAGGSVHIQSPTENLDAPNCYDPRLLACLA